MKIFVTRNIPVAGIEKLKASGYEVIISDKNDALTQGELIEQLKTLNPDAVLCLLTDKIDAAVFDAAPNAKIFANYAVGFDNIDLAEAKKRGVAITNTPGVLTEAVAEHAAALILAIGRRIVEADDFLRNDKYKGWDPMLLLGIELKGKTLGIVGCGRIGQRLAEIMKNGFGMKIIYNDQNRNESLETELAAEFHEIDSLLKEADVVSIHLPATEETAHLFNKDNLAKMKSSALLINTARGSIIDEAALVEALNKKTIASAALDVFEDETSVNRDLASLTNVVLTPHIASATLEAREQMSIIAADNIISVLNNQPPQNPVM